MRDRNNLLTLNICLAGELKGNIAGDPTIIPPVERPIGPDHNRDTVRRPQVIHLNYQDAFFSWLDDRSNIELKGCVAALMLTEILTVQPDTRQIEDRFESQAEMALLGFGRSDKDSPIPTKAFIVSKLGHRVPGVRHGYFHPSGR